MINSMNEARQDDVHVDTAAEFRQVRVRELVWRSEGVVSIGFVSLDGCPLGPWEPGAHLDVQAGPDMVRQYSLCGDPTNAHTWQIAVQRDPRSRGGSIWMHDNVRVGDVLTVRGPRNNFPLVEAEEYLLIAGGIGITPLRAMIAQLQTREARWRLVYGGRSRTTMAFVDELAALGEHVSVVPQDELGIIDLQAEIGQPRSDVSIYCCGPEPLIAAVENACQDWPAGSLHVERFRADIPVVTPDSTSFEVVLEKTGTTIVVGPSQSILEAMEDASIAVSFGCREGICGTCETKVLGGLPEHRDLLLSEAERTANTSMMVCVSRALSPQLVLDL